VFEKHDPVVGEGRHEHVAFVRPGGASHAGTAASSLVSVAATRARRRRPTCTPWSPGWPRRLGRYPGVGPGTTPAWLTAHRRVARDYERDPATSEAMIRWAAIGLTTQRRPG
jgi:hypothetical protein